MTRTVALTMLTSFALAFAAAAQGQPAPAPSGPPAPAHSAAPSTYATPIGAPIGLEAAKKVAAAAAAEAVKDHWFMAIAVVDPAGVLVYYQKADTTQNGSAEVAIAKARSSALYKRPTKAFQDAVAGGGMGLRILGLPGAVPLDGGLPLLVEGKLVGAVGVSGDLAENDGKCAAAGAAALAPAAAAK
ncbi:MAG TPA: heme-binding protein [Myxococcales bacterium]|nr:heme-binding protein [Myxococcales bacterium]